MVRNRNQTSNCGNPEEGLHSPFQGRETLSIQYSSDKQPLSRSSKEQCFKRTSPKAPCKRSYRGSSKSLNSWILLKDFPGSKEGRLEANYRPQQSESIFRNSKIQNGNSRVCQGIHSTRRMDNINRPDRCLPPYSNTSKIQKIPEISDRAKGLPIQGTTFWAGNSTLSVHQDCKSSERIFYNPEHHNPSVSRRLDQQNIILPRGSGKNQTTQTDFGEPGIPDKSEKVPAETNTKHDLYRLSLQPIKGNSATTRREGHCPSTGNTLVSFTENYNCEKPYACHRSSGVNRENGSLWQDPYQATSTVSQQPMGLEDSIGVSNKSRSTVQKCSDLVDSRGEPLQRVSSSPRTLPDATFHRCIQYGMGSPLSSAEHRRSVVYKRSKETHKCFGDEGCLVSPPTFSKAVERQSCPVINRQLNCGLIHKQTGRHKICRSLCPDLENSNMDKEKQHNSVSQTHSRLPECNGRSPVLISQSSKHRMVSKSPDFQETDRETGDSKHRYVCNLPKQQIANICITIPRPCCMGSGCNVNRLDKPAFLCIPSNNSIDKDHIKDQERTLQGASHCSTVASDALVSGSDRPHNTRSSQIASSVVSPETTTQRDLQPNSANHEPSCISDPILSLKNRGFEDKLAVRIANPQRDTTLKIYKGKWNIFLKWAKLKDDEISKISIPLIAKFLLHLFEDLALEVATIEGYKTAIANQLRNVSSLDVASDGNLKDLLKSFYRDRPRNMRTLPHWDLSIVLHALSKPPYEPLHKAELKWLTLKTVFLVALASGKRRSEIHALIFNKIKYNRTEDSYSLGICPSFVAKNQVTRKLNETLRNINIIGLRNRVGPDMAKERCLCPVRSLAYYLDRTKDLRDKNQRKLFISFKENHKKDICANTISGWLKYVIRHAYNLEIPEKDLKMLNITAHSVRSVAVSWAATGGASIDQILNACQWQSESSFTSFYLKEVQWDHQENEINNFIAAQTVVNPNRKK